MVVAMDSFIFSLGTRYTLRTLARKAVTNRHTAATKRSGEE